MGAHTSHYLVGKLSSRCRWARTGGATIEISKMMMRHRTTHPADASAVGCHFQQLTSGNISIDRAIPHHETPRERKRKKGPMIESNHAMIALAGCCFFLGCVASTIVLICFRPRRPHDVHSLFWEQKVHLARQLQQHQQHMGQQEYQIQQRRRQKDDKLVQTTEKLLDLDDKCPSYGCPLYPIEMTNITSTEDYSFVSTNHIMFTHQSNRREPAPVNQDKIVMIPTFASDNTQLHSSNHFFIGLFDGHDSKGHEIASYASKEIPALIASKLHDRDKSLSEEKINSVEMNQIITETFRKVDADAPPSGGGCTASVVIRLDRMLFLANTGDSTQFIAIYEPPSSKLVETTSVHNERYMHNMTRPTKEVLQLQGRISIHHQNKLHKAHFPEEKARIENLGGRVHIPPNNPMGSRVIVRSATHREDVGLAMSRSIGDWEWTAVGVIPDPDVQVVNLEEFWEANDVSKKDAKVFVVLGSDGLFDARRVEFVARHLAFGFFESPRKSEGDFVEQMLTVGRQIVNMASPIKPEYYRDDISFVAKVVEL